MMLHCGSPIQYANINSSYWQTHLDVYKRQLPFFFFAMYERDGLPLEKVLKNIIRTRFLYPRVRPYKTENFYALLGARKEAQPIAKQQKGRKARRQKA